MLNSFTHTTHTLPGSIWPTNRIKSVFGSDSTRPKLIVSKSRQCICVRCAICDVIHGSDNAFSVFVWQLFLRASIFSLTIRCMVKRKFDVQIKMRIAATAAKKEQPFINVTVSHTTDNIDKVKMVEISGWHCKFIYHIGHTLCVCLMP